MKGWPEAHSWRYSLIQTMTDDPDESFVITAMTEGTLLPSWVEMGPGDDTAILKNGQVVTTDLLIEDVHFTRDQSPENIATKLIAVNASDVAAAGARPTWALLSIALPHPIDTHWVQRFSHALRSELNTQEIALIGGDTTRSPGPIFLNLCLAGKLVTKTPLLRSTASPNEDIWVSGFLGDASGGFHLDDPTLRARFERPQPPLELGPRLAEERLATAAMDISDGLLTDLGRLCDASGCGARIEREQLPASPELIALTDDLLPHQVAFGEDYQLLFCAKQSDREAILRIGDELSVQLTRIGHTTPSTGIQLPGVEELTAWTHFGNPTT